MTRPSKALAIIRGAACRSNLYQLGAADQFCHSPAVLRRSAPETDRVVSLSENCIRRGNRNPQSK